MIDLMPGIEITLYLISWAAATVAALALWNWCSDDRDG